MSGFGLAKQMTQDAISLSATSGRKCRCRGFAMLERFKLPTSCKEMY